jgi:hypothetical protein
MPVREAFPCLRNILLAATITWVNISPTAGKGGEEDMILKMRARRISPRLRRSDPDRQEPLPEAWFGPSGERGVAVITGMLHNGMPP